MGRKFAEKACLVEHVGYDPASMATTFGLLIDNHLLLIGENGALGAMAGPHPFNHAHIIAQELFWWSEGREGLRLLDAFEAWAAQRAHSVRMITLEAVNPDRMARLYERRGYQPLERGFIKVL